LDLVREYEVDPSLAYLPHVAYEEVCRHLLYFVHGKNDSWNRHAPYISIGKLLKIKLIVVYCLPHVCLVTFQA